MKLESRLFSIARGFFVFLLCIAFSNVVYAARVPESNPTATALPETCDPEFWDVLKDRAWLGGQREITQNNNLIARSDSVISLSCFSSSLNHLAWYADNYFPGNPDASKGGFGGSFTDLFIILPDTIAYGANVNATQGFLMHAVLELVVLDALSGRGAGQGYINDNFPAEMLGGRAIGISAHVPSTVSVSRHNGCDLMNDVWMAAKCYNFISEPSHDGFYSLETYSTSADYRTKDQQCPSAPTWGSAFAGANPDPGAAGGADGYEHFLELRDSGYCSSLTPVKTGFIVQKGTATKYYDAVCPAPGCYFNPPSSLSGNGSCN